MTDGALVGYCGLYCGACPHYRAAQTDGAHLLEAACRARGCAPHEYTCSGCRSEALYMHVGCAACTLRACAQAQGLDDCGACPQLPCERLAAFIHDGHPHHRDVPDLLASLRALGPERWLATQRARWTCLCGAHLSWYETTCPRCGAAHAVYIREKP